MQRIAVSYRTIIFVILAIVSTFAIYKLRNVLLLWFISFIIMTALNPLVTKMQKLRIPRGVAIFISFVIIGIVIGLIIAAIIPPLIDQTTILAKNLTLNIPNSEYFQFDPSILTSQLELIGKNALNVLDIAVKAFGNIFTIFTLIVFTFYLLLERRNLPNHLSSLFNNARTEAHYQKLMLTIERRLGGWVRGEIALMFIVGFLSYLGLTLLHIPFALPLALLAGLLELIPNIGPTIAAIPAVIVGFTLSPAIAIGVLVLYLAIQQLENNIIVPMVMKQSLGINPLVTLMCLMVGLALGGIAGTILSVPIFITAQSIISHFYTRHRTT